MAQYKSEYSKPTVGGNVGGYSSLGCYSGSNATMPHLQPGTKSGVHLTPDYTGISYSALTHGVQGGYKQYFNIQDAYGSGASNCSTSYTSRLCGGGCSGGKSGSGKRYEGYHNNGTGFR